MLNQHLQSYEALTEALSIHPDSAELWYNRGMACQYTIRFGQSLRDYERALELADNSELVRKATEGLKHAQMLVQASLEMRGKDFTLDQLIKQEELFQSGL